MTILNINETKIEGLSEEEIKEYLYNEYISKLNNKKPLTALEEARAYVHKVTKNGYDRSKIWYETKRQVRDYYGVNNVGEIPTEKVQEANDKAIEIIDSIISNH